LGGKTICGSLRFMAPVSPGWGSRPNWPVAATTPPPNFGRAHCGNTATNWTESSIDHATTILRSASPYTTVPKMLWRPFEIIP
jgi:hypothetical protein